MKTKCLAGTRREQRRAKRRYRDLDVDMLLTEEKQLPPDPTVYVPNYTFDDFDT